MNKSVVDDRNHAAHINHLIHETLLSAGLLLADMNAIVVCAGPGSYTGLRIGLSIAKGICYALDKPLLLDNKLTLLAYHQFLINAGMQREYNYVTILRAREKEYYYAAYNKEFLVITYPLHISLAILKENIKHLTGKTILTGDLDIDIEEFLNVDDFTTLSQNIVDLDSWAKYANEDYKCNRTVNLSMAEPFYLKQVYTNK